MNSLSWLIYFAGLVHSLIFITVIVSFVCFTIWIIARCAFIMHHERMITKEDQEQLPSGNYLIVGFICAGIASILPSKNTVMLIAASELGQRLVTSQQVVDVVDPSIELLKTWIKKESEAMKK
jgi:hypothetical protein